MVHVLELSRGPAIYPPSFTTGFTESPDLVLLVERALVISEETKGAALDILVHGETVVLMGRVVSESVRAAAERVARSVPGVSVVENNLQVEVERD